jgi:putative phage-type endonuclease
MLKKENISKAQIYTDDWQQCRRGKFTSSKISCLMGEKGLSSGAYTYIDQKLGEEMTGHVVSEDEMPLDDENTVWGNTYEPKAIELFHSKNKIQFLVTQKLIHAPNTRFSSTPDAIWVHGEASNQLEYNVSTLEVKCPRKFHRFNKLFRCKKPQDLLSAEPKYFWQVIDQMDNCDSAVGYFAVYHPLYPEGCNFRQIQFKKLELWDEFKKLKQRKTDAVNLLLQWKSEFVPV